MIETVVSKHQKTDEANDGQDVKKKERFSRIDFAIEQWYDWASKSKLALMVAKAKMLKRHLPGLLNYFQHRLTNAMSEGFNSKIMSIKRRTGGYRNRENFKNAIFFYCGGLDLYPR